MRTYDDTFGGTRIYPGKVSVPLRCLRFCALVGGWRHMHIWIITGSASANAYNYLTGETLRSRRQQSVPFPKRQIRIPLPPEKEPSTDRMDDLIPKTAQEGYLRGQWCFQSKRKHRALRQHRHICPITNRG